MAGTSSKRSGAKMTLYDGTIGTLIQGAATPVALPANKLFMINTKASTGSGLPAALSTGSFFMTPDAASLEDISPVVGDSVYPISLERVCKTDTEYTMEEGTIDTTDDCDSGYNSSELDGFVTISGTINGHLRFLDENGELVPVVEAIMNRFIDVVEDDGDGNYTLSPKDNKKSIMFLELNNDAEVGDVKNILITPVLFSSVASGAGLKDIQKRDISWTKGQGSACLYKRTVGAGDVI